MRSPESRPGHRPGRTFEEELNLRYLSPGAFTVLSSDVTGAPPDPPRAPQPYRVSPSVKRHRNQAFSILAEPVAAVRSRSPSPSSGRVSPFRGRGFNPAGSRHASPVPPSPPEDTRRFKQNPNKSEQRKSLIPQLQRRGSAVLSTEDSDSSPKFRRKSTTALRPQLSKSLNYIGPQNVAYKPPPNPRRAGGAPKNPLFSRLSPIAGSSPEPSSDKSTSSPSRIPMSRSTPPSRKPSPSREFSPGRVGSRAASRNSSRESSPGGRSQFSPTRIPLRNGVKVNNAKRTSSPDKAAKAPTKTQEIRNRMEQNKNRTSVSRRGSVSNRSVTNSGGKVSVGSVNTRSNKSSVSSTGTAKGGTKTVGKAGTKAGKSEAGTSDTSTKPKKVSATKTPAAEGGDETGRPTAKPRLTLKTLATSKATFSTAMKLAGSSAPGGRPGSRPGSKPGSKPGSLHGSPARKPSGIEAAMQRIGSSGKLNETATTVVTTTTSTVTTPLKIDAKIEEQPEEPPPKETPMYLDEDSQTLLKDHNLSKLSPAAATVVSLSNDGGGGGGAASVAQAVPSVETVKTETSQIVHSSVVGNGADGKGSNNMSKLITPDDSFGAKVNNMSANERIKEARTMVASDVKPIKITVREKPNDVEVQSGNVRFPTNATNGVSSTLGAPPLPPENGNQPPEEQPAKSRCRTMMEKIPCCKPKSEKLEENKKGCFDFLKKSKKAEVEQIIVSSPEEAEEAKKKSCLERLNCCKGNKVGDSGGWCRKKKDVPVVNRRDSILSEPLTKRQKCKNFFKTLFCCGSTCCQRRQSQSKVEDSRRESMLSKKKSLTPTVLPPEEPKNKLDTSLVEYTSTMKAAIPILPVYLAYFCCFFNVFAPGTGTVFSGLFCLCMGIPRFSQKDGPKPRFGSFIINTIIGCGQCFTVLFCLVGWGWSIWWGVIMIKVAKKYRKLKKIELAQEAHEAREKAAAAAAGAGTTPNRKKDVEKGRA